LETKTVGIARFQHWHTNFFYNVEETNRRVMNTTMKILTGFLVGTMLGAITGLLLAPATGKRTRKNIEKKSKKLARQVAGYIGVSKPTKAAHRKNGKASVQTS
jgi:gas vesicle protein